MKVLAGSGDRTSDAPKPSNPRKYDSYGDKSDFDAVTTVRWQQITSSQALCLDSMFCKNYTVALILIGRTGGSRLTTL